MYGGSIFIVILLRIEHSEMRSKMTIKIANGVRMQSIQTTVQFFNKEHSEKIIKSPQRI
jgi:hypothetical protein